MTNIRVTAPLVAVTDENNNVRQLRQGDVVPDGVTKESIAHLRSLGYVENIGGDSRSDGETKSQRQSSK